MRSALDADIHEFDAENVANQVRWNVAPEQLLRAKVWPAVVLFHHGAREGAQARSRFVRAWEW